MSKFLGYEQCPRCAARGRDTKGDNLAVYEDGSKHCFSCRYHKFPTRYVRKENGDESLRTENKKVLPNDFSREIPARAWKWLLQYGLGVRYWQQYCGYSEKESRLIFTVGTPVDFSIGRFIEDERGNPPGRGGEFALDGDTARVPRKWYCYGDAHKTAHIYGDPSTSEYIVLVEDLISAHKVGQVTACIPLFGTNVFNSVINALRVYRKHVIMWLDNDQRDLAIKRSARLSLLSGCEVRYIFTEKDPKCYSIDKIKEILND